jgi:hypothetical protein
VTVTGGSVTIAAGSDGIDSNGAVTLSGGTVATSAQGGGGGNGALDVNGAAQVSGGAVTVDASAIQAGQKVTVVGSDGATVAAFVATGAPSTQLVIASGITAEESYTVMADGEAIGTAVATEASQAAADGPSGGRGRR